jgi:hypothetical protein
LHSFVLHKELPVLCKGSQSRELITQPD